ncbi:hypothetical protein VNO77_25897 [Canavalia gladiata]|uniref:Uncharacterized protein n=1 Tax=Canavalia gladiata TaxID=3824 RepID=A0AAN9KSA0_CANGL
MTVMLAIAMRCYWRMMIRGLRVEILKAVKEESYDKGDDGRIAHLDSVIVESEDVGDHEIVENDGGVKFQVSHGRGEGLRKVLPEVQQGFYLFLQLPDSSSGDGPSGFNALAWWCFSSSALRSDICITYKLIYWGLGLVRGFDPIVKATAELVFDEIVGGDADIGQNVDMGVVDDDAGHELKNETAILEESRSAEVVASQSLKAELGDSKELFNTATFAALLKAALAVRLGGGRSLDAAMESASQLEAEGKDDLNFTINILNAMISSIVHVTNIPRKKVVKWFEDRRSEEGVPDHRLPYQRSVPETS